MAAYGMLDRLLHRLALQVRPIAELSFDLDQRLTRTEPDTVASARHVFVSGLARAGTTALMRGFHATGHFRSLTYRDMPFVLAPNLWRRLAKASTREIEAAERAHGDRVMVDLDSPESLDEVFWRIFAGDDYIARDGLAPHTPDEETIAKFVGYVAAILAAQDAPAARYLSKNNNNILRLPAIRRAFPNALILIPFRDPVEQARSLLQQHRRFSRLQADDGFALSYMTWLAHHEFGLAYRPFRFDGGAPAAPRDDTDRLDHWLRSWCETYEWLERAAPADAVFVRYESLCDDPATWRRLAAMADVAVAADADSPFRVAERKGGDIADAALNARAGDLYARLRHRAHEALA